MGVSGGISCHMRRRGRVFGLLPTPFRGGTGRLGGAQYDGHPNDVTEWNRRLETP